MHIHVAGSCDLDAAELSGRQLIAERDDVANDALERVVIRFRPWERRATVERRIGWRESKTENQMPRGVMHLASIRTVCARLDDGANLGLSTNLRDNLLRQTRRSWINPNTSNKPRADVFHAIRQANFIYTGIRGVLQIRTYRVFRYCEKVREILVRPEP